MLPIVSWGVCVSGVGVGGGEGEGNVGGCYRGKGGGEGTYYCGALGEGSVA